ncbi:hypothetical protein PX699_02320 [Sphingobium sp. H39-3-25]|uniref:hypothetical protein n=1 Tax=Sphingobium arseniciresistens TaxID=3030834 RepID=UPI0023B9DB88|nr:hypothetical protein [Sphingobium arseniciresistens]MDF0541165.1 hypothetical protein [Sphingobium arseniciresistens]
MVEALTIVIEHGERCGDDGPDGACPICRGEMSPEFIEWLGEAVAAAEAQPGKAMTAEEAIEWLGTL